MCIEYDRTPIRTYIYLSLCLSPLNAFFFVREEGVGVGVTLIIHKDYHLHLLCRWANSIFFTFFSHKFQIIDPNAIFPSPVVAVAVAVAASSLSSLSSSSCRF